MKKGLLISTTLAMLLGVGVAVGAHQAKSAEEVKAADNVTLYCKMTYSWWTVDGAAIGVHYWGGDNPTSWPGVRGIEVATDENVWKFSVPSNSTGLIFTRVNPSGTVSDWGAKTDDLSLPTDGKNLFTITQSTAAWDGAKSAGEWGTYVEPAAASVYKYSVNGGTAVEMTKSGNEYVSASASFKKGDVLSFTKDSAAYAVAPKDSGQQTKVYAVEGGLKFAEDYTGVLYLDVSANVLWAGQFTPGYYLAGVGGEWQPKLAASAHKVAEEDPAYVVENVHLEANEEIKFINFPTEGNVVTWYNADPEKVYTDTEAGYEVIQEEGESFGNLKITKTSDYDIYYNPESSWYSITDKNYAPDVPAEEGYYICGEFSSVESWTYENASKMVSPSGIGDNVAHLMNFYVAAGDKLRVRSYYNDQEPKDRWAKLGTGIEDYGHPSKSSEDPVEYDNFEFDKAGYYDIYAYYENDIFTYFVAEHVDSYTISMHGLKYAGKDKVGNTIDFADQTAYSTSNFEPAILDQEGYVARGVYYDEACTEPYTPKKFTEADELYIKYTKLTSYLTGDETFLGEGHGWDVDYSTEIGPQGTNKYVGTVVVPAGVDADHPMKVKPLEYVADTDAEQEGNQPGWGGIYFTPGYKEEEAPDFVSIDENGNFSFVKPGTYAFYVNGEDKVWFNGGEYAFHTAFLTQVGGTCDSDGKTTDLETLSTLWSQFETAFGKLSPEEQKHVKDYTIDGGDEKSKDDCLKMIAMYSYIVHKYGTEAFKDFIWGGSYPDLANIIPFNSTVESNNAFIVVAVIASITTLSTAVLLVIKKRKRQ